jgi:hypothetical protein
MFTVTRTPASQYSPEMAEVHVDLPTSGSARVTLYGPDIRFGSPSPSTVNWSAIGSVSAEDALVYAGAIALAASIAPTLAPATGRDEVATTSAAAMAALLQDGKA